MTRIDEIVGAHFRPPAKAILSTLFGDCPLELRPEPDNPYDPNAIAVWINSKHINADHCDVEALASNAPFFGKSLEEIQHEAGWHLGYIRKEVAATIVDQFLGETMPAMLAFLSNGKPAARFTLDAQQLPLLP